MSFCIIHHNQHMFFQISNCFFKWHFFAPDGPPDWKLVVGMGVGHLTPCCVLDRTAFPIDLVWLWQCSLASLWFRHRLRSRTLAASVVFVTQTQFHMISTQLASDSISDMHDCGCDSCLLWSHCASFRHCFGSRSHGFCGCDAWTQFGWNRLSYA